MVTSLPSLQRATGFHPRVRNVVLGCGIVSSVWYVVTDVLGALRYEGYSYTDQVFSEMTAAGSPVRPFMVALNGVPYTLLMVAFGIGVWRSAAPQRAAHITGALLVGYALTGMAGGVFFPMAARGIDGTLRNTMHIPATAVMSLCILLAIGFGGTLFERRFRYYSYGTIAVLIVFGVLTSLQGPDIAANKPTPWAGIEERINVYATLLWLATLGISLWRKQASDRSGEPRLMMLNPVQDTRRAIVT